MTKAELLDGYLITRGVLSLIFLVCSAVALMFDRPMVALYVVAVPAIVSVVELACAWARTRKRVVQGIR